MTDHEAAGFWAQYRRAPKLIQFGLPVVVVVIAAAAGGSHSPSPMNGSSPTSPATTHVSGNPNRPNEATADYTPSVGPAHPVTVDGLVYKVESARTSPVVGDPTGLNSTATGVYVIVRLRVHSDKSGDAQFSDNVHLVAPGRSYSPDASATTTLTAVDGETQLALLPMIGSHETVTGVIVFDVAPDTLRLHPQMKFTELGLGDTKGYIALPPLSA